MMANDVRAFNSILEMFEILLLNSKNKKITKLKCSDIYLKHYLYTLKTTI